MEFVTLVCTGCSIEISCRSDAIDQIIEAKCLQCKEDLQVLNEDIPDQVPKDDDGSNDKDKNDEDRDDKDDVDPFAVDVTKLSATDAAITQLAIEFETERNKGKGKGKKGKDRKLPARCPIPIDTDQYPNELDGGEMEVHEFFTFAGDYINGGDMDYFYKRIELPRGEESTFNRSGRWQGPLLRAVRDHIDEALLKKELPAWMEFFAENLNVLAARRKVVELAAACLGEAREMDEFNEPTIFNKTRFSAFLQGLPETSNLIHRINHLIATAKVNPNKKPPTYFPGYHAENKNIYNQLVNDEGVVIRRDKGYAKGYDNKGYGKGYGDGKSGKDGKNKGYGEEYGKGYGGSYFGNEHDYSQFAVPYSEWLNESGKGSGKGKDGKDGKAAYGKEPGKRYGKPAWGGREVEAGKGGEYSEQYPQLTPVQSRGVFGTQNYAQQTRDAGLEMQQARVDECQPIRRDELQEVISQALKNEFNTMRPATPVGEPLLIHSLLPSAPTAGIASKQGNQTDPFSIEIHSIKACITQQSTQFLQLQAELKDVKGACETQFTKMDSGFEMIAKMLRASGLDKTIEDVNPIPVHQSIDSVKLPALIFNGSGSSGDLTGEQILEIKDWPTDISTLRQLFQVLQRNTIFLADINISSTSADNLMAIKGQLSTRYKQFSDMMEHLKSKLNKKGDQPNVELVEEISPKKYQCIICLKYASPDNEITSPAGYMWAACRECKEVRGIWPVRLYDGKCKKCDSKPYLYSYGSRREEICFGCDDNDQRAAVKSIVKCSDNKEWYMKTGPGIVVKAPTDQIREKRTVDGEQLSLEACPEGDI